MRCDIKYLWRLLGIRLEPRAIKHGASYLNLDRLLVCCLKKIVFSKLTKKVTKTVTKRHMGVKERKIANE